MSKAVLVFSGTAGKALCSQQSGPPRMEITSKSTSMWERKDDSEGGVTASKGGVLAQEPGSQDLAWARAAR